MPDASTLTTIAAIIAGFGVAMLYFRIQRELDMSGKGEVIWIPYSDWLLIIATVTSLLFVILPVLVFPDFLKLPKVACGISTIMVAGYIFGILAHYRLILKGSRTGPRNNPEPSERYIVWITIFFAAFISIFILLRR